ncbi:MAG: type II toxin-antitoxin system HicB family antitoxin [Fretibacterium sp.]|nr:type II toxin-antitoxin system HicB family antitoxin [Fretibacterium sp.]
MKTYYMVIERDSEGWYVGSVPALPGCHTQARIIEELTPRMEEAIALYLEDADMPQSEFIGVQRVTVS